MNHLKIFDTTLRDGEQSAGAAMSADEKLKIALQLERMRVDVIEAGFPPPAAATFSPSAASPSALKTASSAASPAPAKKTSPPPVKPSRPPPKSGCIPSSPPRPSTCKTNST